MTAPAIENQFDNSIDNEQDQDGVGFSGVAAAKNASGGNGRKTITDEI